MTGISKYCSGSSGVPKIAGDLAQQVAAPGRPYDASSVEELSCSSANLAWDGAQWELSITKLRSRRERVLRAHARQFCEPVSMSEDGQALSF